MAGGWGLGFWGTGSWGFGSSSLVDLYIANAFAVTTRTVRVTLSTQPQQIFGTLVGDVLNPATWTVTRVDDSTSLTVVAVEPINTSTYTYDVRILEEFGSAAVTYRVASTTLLRSDGAPITPPNFYDFIGVAFTSTEVLTSKAPPPPTMVDVANPPFPSDNSLAVGGTLIINSYGDYESVAGEELVKKLIIRRITTQLGGFFHLPDYGIGIGVKQLLPIGDLVKLQTEIERQVKLEPEVQNARVTLSLIPADNLLEIDIVAQLVESGAVIRTGVRTKANVLF